MSRLPTLSIDEDFPQMTMCAFRVNWSFKGLDILQNELSSVNMTLDKSPVSNGFLDTENIVCTYLRPVVVCIFALHWEPSDCCSLTQ